MNKQKRISANFLRKFAPSLRRVSTPDGRKWTVNGKEFFDTLQDVIEHSLRIQKNIETKLFEVLNAEAEKGDNDVSSS